METIEQRIEKVLDVYISMHPEIKVSHEMRKGAITSLSSACKWQLDIDIQCVCEWLNANRFAYDQTSDNQFSDMLQQLVKAMKGE